MPEFVHRLRVRYGECDPQGWVFNANYLMYADVALTELWREAIGPYGEMVERGVDMVVGEANLRFRAPASFDDELDVAVEVTRLGTTSLTTTMRISNAAGPVAEAQLRHVFIAVDGGGKIDIPAWIRRGLEPYVVQASAPVAQPAQD